MNEHHFEDEEEKHDISEPSPFIRFMTTRFT